MTATRPVPRTSYAADRSVTALRSARGVLAELFGPPAGRPFAVRYWEGTVEAPDGTVPRFTLILRRPGALRRMLLPPSELALGEAYLRDDFDVEGDLEATAALADTLVARLRSPAALVRAAAGLRALPTDDVVGGAAGTVPAAPGLSGRRHSRRRDRQAIRHHYDVGNDFYARWLDRRMVYSCAYFATGTEDLGAAQEAKLDLICRKLRLRPGERLLDIGCGWGGLVRHAAERYGVVATGITLSESQAALARARIADAGLADRCRIEVRDYRDLGPAASFDKIASVGMCEHVGRARLPEYFATAHRLLRPGGLFLNHGIVELGGAPAGLVRRATDMVWRPGSFMERYVFPDGELVAPGATLALAEAVGFETRDVESLREHYVLTLRHWVRRLEARHDAAVLATDERRYRIWRLYMAGCARAFADGRVGVIQALLSKPDQAGRVALPLTRADLDRREANGLAPLGGGS